MCFSAEASFISSSLLATTGIAAQFLVSHNKDRLLASLPLLFAAHQTIEGMLWLSFTWHMTQDWQNTLAHLYLMYAYVLIPVLWPVAFYLTEEDPRIQQRLRLLCMAGILLAAYLFVWIVLEPVTASALSHGIRYTLDFPFKNPARAIYFLVAASPCLCSSPYIKMLGYSTILACIVTFFVFWNSFVSTWCFFTALLSLFILLELRLRHNSFPDD